MKSLLKKFCALSAPSNYREYKHFMARAIFNILLTISIDKCAKPERKPVSIAFFFYHVYKQVMTKNTSHMIVAISGASGAAYGVRMLEALRELGIYTHLIMSKTAAITLKLEMDMLPEDVAKLADEVHPAGDMAACISSGSYPTMGMIIAPCSMRSVGEIASGVTSSLLTRAADVVLKERRKLVMMVRETPLHSGHLENMLKLSNMGAIIAPPVPAFYSKPESLDDIVNHAVGRVLDLFDLDTGSVKRWKTT